LNPTIFYPLGAGPLSHFGSQLGNALFPPLRSCRFSSPFLIFVFPFSRLCLPPRCGMFWRHSGQVYLYRLWVGAPFPRCSIFILPRPPYGGLRGWDVGSLPPVALVRLSCPPFFLIELSFFFRRALLRLLPLRPWRRALQFPPFPGQVNSSFFSLHPKLPLSFFFPLT